tara:strand:- start:421 stop:915 length:495 start_codon:yes stop_codon:yes gene_type:complete
MTEAERHFIISDPDPAYPGWNTWVLTDPDCYNSFLGPMIVRRGGDGLSEDIARVRMFPEIRHRNLGDVVHGGTMMGFIDCSLFAAMRVLELGPSGFAVTLELQTQFLGGARMTEPLESQVEITRETGRFLFMRGLVVQGENGQDNMASFTAIVKKAPGQKTDLQ